METIKFSKGKAGRYAYKVHKAFRLGLNIIPNGDSIIFRLCYFRGKTGTHYCQLVIIRKHLKGELQG